MSIESTSGDHLLGVAQGVSARINAAGRLTELGLASLRAPVVEDGWYVVVDGRMLVAGDQPDVTTTATGLRCDFVLAGSDLTLSVDYTVDDVAIYRTLSLVCTRDMWIDEIGFRGLSLRAPTAWAEVRTFHEAGFGACGRGAEATLLTGIQNPQVVVDAAEGCTVSYRPALLVKAGERFVSSPQFLAICASDARRVVPVTLRSRVGASERFHRGRFREPRAENPLSPTEIAVLQAVVRHYTQPLPRDFKFILYTYWLPLPRLPSSEDDVRQWIDTIDNFADLGGELLLAVPMADARLPGLGDDDYWELEPPGSYAERIMQHARSRGLAVGYYMGVAAGNLPFSNAPGLGTPTGSPRSWKKVNRDGSVGVENCLAHADYAAWLDRVTRNTIARYGLAAWSWDPGPGHGRFCHATDHGHLPGEGGHLGWLRGQALIAGLHNTFGDLHLQSFYGQKEDGSWGLRGFSQHEGYWEQQLEWGASLFADASTERQNGNGVREQGWNSLNFRFLPAEINHALAGRMTQMCTDGVGLANIFDHWGWEFGLKSAIATGGRLSVSTLPPRDAGPEVRERYRAWVDWARADWPHAGLTRALGAPVGSGGVDVFARVGSDGGTVFLSNPNSQACVAELDLSETLSAPMSGWRLRELNPEPGRIVEAIDGGGFNGSGTIRVLVPPLEVIVASVERAIGPLADGPAATASSALRSRVYPLARWTDASTGQPFAYPRNAASTQVGVRSSVELAGWRATRSAGGTSAADLRRRNPSFPDVFSYVDPSRVHLVVPLRDPILAQEIAASIDENPVAGEWYEIRASQTAARFPGAEQLGWPDVRIVWLADITEHIPDSGRFDLGLQLTNLEAQQFLGPWLQVPAFVTPQGDDGRGGLADAIPPAAPPRVEARLAGAWLSGPLAEHATFRVTARVENPENVDAVFASTVTGAGVMFDLALEPLDIGRTTWEKEVRIGQRAAIILDPDHMTVWVRSVSGHVGNALRVPVEWNLPRGPDEKA